MRTLALLLVFLTFAPACARAEGWAFKNLLPGKTESETKKTTMVNGRPLIGSPYAKRAESSSAGPSVFTRMGQGTKAFFAKTTDVLTSPFQRDEPASKTVSSFPTWQQSSNETGSRWSNKKEVEEQQPGWFGSLFQQNEAPHPSRTVSDFLGQDRPGGGL